MTTIAFMALAVVIVWLVTYEPAHTRDFWLREKSALEVITPLGAILVAAIGGAIAWRSYAVNRSAAASTRFQKGVDMLAAPSQISQSGGITFLEDVAGEYPDRYVLPVAFALSAFIRTASKSEWDKLYGWIRAGLPAAELEWGNEPSLAVDALIVMSHTPNDLRWPRSGFGAERAVWIDRAVLQGRHRQSRLPLVLVKVNFRKINFAEVILHQVTFVECDFIDCTFFGYSAGDLTFDRCVIRDARFDLTNVKSGRTTFRNCTVQNSKFRDHDFSGNSSW